MVDQDQEKPLTPSADRTSSDGEGPPLPLKKNPRRKRCLQCCAAAAAVILLLAVTVVVLIFTVFRVKDPVIKLNAVSITQLQLINNTQVPKPGTNVSVIADVSVKNPNIASFKYDNTTSQLYYRGELVGEARGPPGRAAARRTVRMNVTVDLVADKLTGNPNLAADLGGGILTMGSYSKIPGRVKMLGIIRRHITVKMNCSISVNITTQSIVAQKCKRKVDL